MSWRINPLVDETNQEEKETFIEAMEHARELCNGYTEVVVTSQDEKFQATYVLRKLWD